jgi:hypothetical protein
LLVSQHFFRSAKRCLEILDELFGRDRPAPSSSQSGHQLNFEGEAVKARFGISGQEL